MAGRGVIVYSYEFKRQNVNVFTFVADKESKRSTVQYVERLRALMIFLKTFWMFAVNTRVLEKVLNQKVVQRNLFNFL